MFAPEGGGTLAQVSGCPESLLMGDSLMDIEHRVTRGRALRIAIETSGQKIQACEQKNATGPSGVRVGGLSLTMDTSQIDVTTPSS